MKKSTPPNNSGASWSTVRDSSLFVRDYETRVEPFTASFAEELLQPILPTVDKASSSSSSSSSEHVVATTPRHLLLDVGCGTVSLLACEQGFHVTATDVNADMVRRVEERHEQIILNGQQQTNGSSLSSSLLETAAVDGQNLPLAWSNRFNSAVGAFSIIFFGSPLKGLQEIHRCLIPSGQVVLSAWGNAAETPAFQVFPDAFHAVTPNLTNNAEVGRITGSPSTLTKLFEEAGFVDIRIRGPVTRIWQVATADDYYDRFALGSPKTIAKMSEMTDEERQALKQKVVDIATERGGQAGGSIALPASAYFAYGTKPSTS